MVNERVEYELSLFNPALSVITARVCHFYPESEINPASETVKQSEPTVHETIFVCELLAKSSQKHYPISTHGNYNKF